MNNAAELAKKLSSQGWHVFPCNADKSPRVKWKRKNTKWTFKPDDLIGIWCEESGFFAVDLDVKDDKDGVTKWKELVLQHEPTPPGPRQKTPSGGYHLLFKLPEDVKVPNKVNTLAQGIDFRSDGYICTGKDYAWLDGFNFDEPLTDAPDWLLDEIREMGKAQRVAHLNTDEQSKGKRAFLLDTDQLNSSRVRNMNTDQSNSQRVADLSTAADKNPGEYWLQKYLSQAQPGNRNETGLLLACQLRDSDLSQAEAENYMRQYAQGVPGKGYTIKEALMTMKSAYSGSKREPAKSSSPGPIKTEPKQPTEETYIDIEKNIVEHRTIEPEKPKEEGLQIPSAFDILTAEFPEPNWIIKNRLPPGMTIIAGLSKIGKSWLGMQIAQAVACGGYALGERVDQGKVLYLALEDDPRGFQDRMRLQGWPHEAAKMVDVLTLRPFMRTFGPLHKGWKKINDIIEMNNYRFVVVDTLSRAFYGIKDINNSQEVTDALSPIQEMANRLNISLTAMDHHTKGSRYTDPDPILDVMGSSAKGQVADTIWGFYKKEGQAEKLLKGTGRFMREFSIPIKWDRDAYCWQKVDEDSEYGYNQNQRDALQYLKDGPAYLAQIAKALEVDGGNLSRYMKRLVEDGRVSRDDNKLYHLT